MPNTRPHYLFKVDICVAGKYDPTLHINILCATATMVLQRRLEDSARPSLSGHVQSSCLHGECAQQRRRIDKVTINTQYQIN